jgi:hypothetical protein
MRSLCFPAKLQALTAGAAIVLLAACSLGGPSAIVPKPASPQRSVHSAVGRMPQHHFKSFYRCPANGTIEYVSDYNNSIVDIYAGKFAGQAPCGRITSRLNSPWGMYVRPGTHDLYVANDGGHDILVFHRGWMTPYNRYTDPTMQDPVDVTVAKDGTVIATNLVQIHFVENGSISTWIGGRNGGTFVGNFQMKDGGEGEFVAVQKNCTVYYDDLTGQTNLGALWYVSCPAGACGAQTQVAGVSFNSPGGMAFDATGDLVVVEGAGRADTLELPNPTPSTFHLAGYPTGMALNEVDHHLFVADGLNNDAAEYAYPSGVLVGTVPGNSGGGTFGVAVDPRR